MSIVDVMGKFELLLRTRPSDNEIDKFLATITEPDRATMAFIGAWGQQGYLRNQLPFLSALHSDGIYIDRHQRAKTALFYFGGLLTPMFFALARKGLGHLPAHSIYLYDRQLLNYARGIRELGPTSEALYATQRQLFKELGATRVVNVGYSGGAFAAIINALQIQADAAVLFSPFSTFAPAHRIFDNRGASVIERVKNAAPEYLVDTVPMISQSGSALKIVSFHARDLSLDAWHARRLQSLPNTTSFALQGWTSHDIFPPLVGHGAMERFFSSLIENGVEDAVQCLVHWRSDRNNKLSLQLVKAYLHEEA